MSDLVVTVDWGKVKPGEVDSLMGYVFKAKSYKHGVANVVGKWARVHSVKEKASGERSDRCRVLFFLTEEAATAGSLALVDKEEDMTVAAIKGHAGVPPADEGESDSESEPEALDEAAVEEAAVEAAVEAAAEAAERAAEAARAADAIKAAAALKAGAKSPGQQRAPAKTPQKKQAQAAAKEKLKVKLAAIGLSKEGVVARMKLAGVETAEELAGLSGAGVEALPKIVTAASLVPMEEAALGKYMAKASAPRLSEMNKFMGGDDSEDEEDAEEAETAAPAAAPPKGAAKTAHPLLAALLEGVPKARREAAAMDALEGLCEALGKEPTSREKKQVMGSAEAKLKAMGFTKSQIVPAPPGGEAEVSQLITELCTGREKPAAAARGGRGDAAGGEQFGTVAVGQQEPGLATAMGNVLAQPDLLAKLQEIMAAGDSEKTVKALSELAGDESFAALAHKSGDLKVPQGVRQTPAVLGLVHGLGRVRQQRADWVAGQLRAGKHLPAGADAQAVAGKLISGDVGGIDLAAVYACSAVGSMMGSLAASAKAPRGDSTSDAMLVIMRGLAMLQLGYFRSHPFDGSVVETFTGLQAELVLAVQQGVHVTTAWNMLVDPFFAEMGRRWKEVGRLAGPRPVLGAVWRETLTAHNLSMLREHAATCTPAALPSVTEFKKLQQELASSKAELKAAKGANPPQPKGGGNKSSWEALPENEGKCFFWCVHKTCRFGTECGKFATTPGHPKKAVLQAAPQ